MNGRSWRTIWRGSERRESGVKRFAAGKPLKSAEFISDDLSQMRGPAKSKILWGINHKQYHMDEREIVADYLAAGH